MTTRSVMLTTPMWDLFPYQSFWQNEFLPQCFCLFVLSSNNSILALCSLGRKVSISLFKKHMDIMDLSTDGNLRYLQNGISVECIYLDSIKISFKTLVFIVSGCCAAQRKQCKNVTES